MPVRTARLAEGESAGANVTKTVYTCPGGRTAIVKDVRLSRAGSGPSNVILALTSGPRFTNLMNEVVPQGEVRLVEGFLVLEPGDELVINTGVAQGCVYWVSGAELDGVAP